MVNGTSFRSGFNHNKRNGLPRRDGNRKMRVGKIEDALHYVRTICDKAALSLAAIAKEIQGSSTQLGECPAILLPIVNEAL